MKGIETKTGFSLIEVMIAMGVLMVGLVALVELQVFGIHYLAMARQRTIAGQLAAQYLEMLKIVPIDSTNPARIMRDRNNVPFVDADAKALLDDVVIGDGVNTWHRLAPVNERGEMGIGGGGFQYLICYGVEWGGSVIPAGGALPLSLRVAPNEAGETELTLARFPEILPAMSEIYIEVWVGWVASGDKPQIVGVEQLRTVQDYYGKVNDTFPQHPAVFPKHKVVLRTLRRI